jgi:hypothetical protein
MTHWAIYYGYFGSGRGGLEVKGRNEVRARRLRWSSGSHAGLWFPSSRVQARPKSGFFLCKKSPAWLPSEGKLNNLSHVPTLRHLKEPSTCSKLRFASQIPLKQFPPSLVECSRAAWWDGASGDEWGNYYVRGKGTIGFTAAVPKRPC